MTEDDFCPICQCCSVAWEDCWHCDEGFSDHDCGEDTCACLDPEDNVVCDICRGRGGWRVCLGGCTDTPHGPLRPLVRRKD